MSVEEAIRFDIEKLEAEMHPHYAALQPLLERRDVLVQALIALESGEPLEQVEPVTMTVRRSRRTPTFTCIISDLLRIRPKGLASDKIREHVQEVRGKSVAQSTLSTKLSQMKKSRLIHRSGRLWFYGASMTEETS